MSALTGQVAMVTGGAVGIGRATAMALARDGADVALHYRVDEAGAHDAARAIEALGRRAVVLQGDLTKSADVTRTVRAAEREFGRIDILVNNAGGIVGRHSLVEMSEAFFHDVMNVNVLSTFLCSQAVAPGMIARRQGAMINLTSLAAHNGGGPGASVYAAAKAAVLTLTKAWAKELAPHGIRVNAVSPGLIGGTPFHRDFTSPEAFAAAVKAIPLGRAGEPEDVAKVIVFLAGDAASFLAGETIEINGGMYTR
ncbi:MAG TPA: glucose 1-dehydrogenase [Vicinamibacterales bacterium]|nr:glucose 1-dehydrogenase [Vicinamibacterales bacterium]